MASSDYKSDIAKLIIRLTCGGLLMLHGTHSLIHGIDHIEKIVADNGLPVFISYGNIVGEVVAPIFMVIGFYSRIAAAVVAFNMLMSIFLAHTDIMFARNDYGGWMIELNVFFLMTALSVFFSGSGKYAISRGRGRWD